MNDENCFIDNNPYNIFPRINSSFKFAPKKKVYKFAHTNIFIRNFFIDEHSVIFRVNSSVSKYPLIFESMSEMKESLLDKSVKVKKLIKKELSLLCS
jgi:hypothetical protein